MVRITTILILFLSFTNISSAQNNSDLGEESSKFALRGVAELGFLSVLDHDIQFSNNGTEIDYVEEGGQDVLFPFKRFSFEVDYTDKNTFVFLIQPLRIETEQLLSRDLRIDNEVFEEGTGVRFLYNFPFYRFSYLRNFVNNDCYTFSFGVSAQIRNATISFESLDGTKYRRNSDIGFVPALKLRTSAMINDRWYAELEADGIYAPVSYLNGSDNEIVGAILDSSVRLGYKIEASADAFLNLRYLGGGAVGTDPDSEGPGDGYVSNWLHFFTVSLGAKYRL